MSFAENLKRLRKEKGISQEELAELLNVSRQAVSKWEQAEGYPEVEKLLLLAEHLNISLDSLMSMSVEEDDNKRSHHYSGTITVTSPHEHIIAECSKVISSSLFKGGKESPKYALFASYNNDSFFGQSSLFLGWYMNEENIAKEIEEIHKAIKNGLTSYELKYSVKVKKHWMKMKVIDN